jgi:hypothetical protein
MSVLVRCVGLSIRRGLVGPVDVSFPSLCGTVRVGLERTVVVIGNRLLRGHPNKACHFHRLQQAYWKASLQSCRRSICIVKGVTHEHHRHLGQKK